MRLWAKQLIPYLPNKQLISQWRECCCIARNIAVNGTPNHILINKIMDYPDDEFNTYTDAIITEMNRRGYKVDVWKYYKHRKDINNMLLGGIFRGWHTKGYLRVCMANLYEKYNCHGLSTEEWNILCAGYMSITGEKYQI